MKKVQDLSPREAMEKLARGNDLYIKSGKKYRDISQPSGEIYSDEREPYAVILTCSDSYIPPEEIFSSKMGELFVIRTAGNVVGDFELGSVEYGVEHLGAKVVLVLGHSHCGTVAAAMAGNSRGGHIAGILREIRSSVKDAADAHAAEYLNLHNSKSRILENQSLKKLAEGEKILVAAAKYHPRSGRVNFSP